MSIKTILHLLLIFSLGVIAQKTLAQSIRVEANFTPSSVSNTSRTVYKVVIHGTQQNPQGSLPQVPGLRISNNPQSLRSANFINGVPSVRVELNFQVQPQRTGNFTVPAWKVMIEGKSYQVPPATLQVLDPSQQEKQAHQDLRQAAFLELPFSRSYFFEGETIMTSLTLFIWDRLPVNRIENAPTKIGESFSSNNLGKWTAEKRNVSRNGKIYSTFTWPVALTAAMAGTKEISFTVNLRVRVNSRKNSPFSSPFFNDPFFGFGREESLTVELPRKSIEIKPLPSANRPSDYSGAIGNFRAQSSVDANQIEVGDPVRLNFSIEGKGNFAAIPAPILESNEEFKIGPPAFLFEGNEEIKSEGRQNFEFILTPQKAGNLKITPLNFSYFDPIQEKYSTIIGNEINLFVKPGEKWIEPPNQNESQNSMPSNIAMSTNDLFQTASDPGIWHSSLQPKSIESNYWFWTFQILPLSGTLAFGLLGWKRRNKFNEDFRIKKANLSRKLNENADHRDPTGFFRAFKDLTRMQISKKDKSRNTFAFSSDELITFIKEQKFDKNLIIEIEEMLRLGDGLEFAESSSQELDFKDLRRKVSEILKKLS
ncbi:MAG TPA: hypothetical protein DCF87_06710 [Opitutae bacterium]|nr:hypothetical protein [Opitutae bacterium]